MISSWRIGVGGLVLLSVSLSGCDDGKEQARIEAARVEAARAAEEERLEAERAPKLEEAMASFGEALNIESARDQFAQMQKGTPERFRDDLTLIEDCYMKQLEPAREAAAGARFESAPGLALECVSAIEGLKSRTLDRLLAAVEQPSARLSERESKIEGKLIGLANSTVDSAVLLLNVLLQYGPRDARMATFDAIAGGVPPDSKNDWRVVLLQQAHSSENVVASKLKMRAKLEQLGIPLQTESPTPAPDEEQQPSAQ